MIVATPLAERMRPRSIQEVAGQKHLLGPDGVFTRMVESKTIPSMILWGPPGVGKTTLARLLAESTKRPFKTLSAVSAGVKEVREVIKEASFAYGTILFIDEIHRFSKSQQDALLNAVEKGIITLVGATTENPSFEVNSALISRSQVYVLENLRKDDLLQLVNRAIKDDVVLKKKNINIKEHRALLRYSGGDARRLMNLLELSIEAAKENEAGEYEVNDDLVALIAQEKAVHYDKKGDAHYDIISAFIKSIRGSDPNAAVYWLARMIEGGEDPKFIARRLIISASEDIGNANPTALIMANNCMQAVHFVGMPEGRIILSQTTTYLACSPKSNAAYAAVKDAQKIVKTTGDLPVPLHLRNAATSLMKELGYGDAYIYPHNDPQGFQPQEYMPESLEGKIIYQPKQNPREQEMLKRLQNMWKNKYQY
ncbi:AAA family ATPase [Flammeovirga yaeyamensis]|uniref:Replication-associated recombination protein A n=1 Tax=Flammeovirga yaeyamensis TaxID=367791 RepID=A0AAX1N7V4_9BACT|nr:replication-associated recombination protein A [Flammeovirga yaeyamensis]MBB3699071.1 putative ATPase [Flammeovirga yaeyamensis]NMF36505.1 replication-associated recombination protein A [Flammeovirga yaeyamensis]QWG03537.1 AAA family ATPase [Flammeovirga yaeyamensis]